MNLLIENIRKRCLINEEEAQTIMSFFTETKIQKREQFLAPGQTASYSAFVLKGCMRSFSIDANGFEHILQFAPSDWWITDMYSFISNEPSHLTIEAIEPTDVLLISRNSQNLLCDRLPKIERYFRILTENALVANQRRLLDGMSLTAKERYLNFCHIYPGLIHELPQKQIASFIGVTPEFLSKMKKEILLQKE